VSRSTALNWRLVPAAVKFSPKVYQDLVVFQDFSLQMANPLLYQSGDDVRKGDRVLLHGEPAEIEFVLNGDNNDEGWPNEQ
jgi:hypothetical protein